jgi:hypothetical protein
MVELWDVIFYKEMVGPPWSGELLLHMTDILRETLAPDSEPAANDLALVEAEQALFPEGEHRHSYLKAATGLGIVAVSAVAANR